MNGPLHRLFHIYFCPPNSLVLLIDFKRGTCITFKLKRNARQHYARIIDEDAVIYKLIVIDVRCKVLSLKNW